MCAAVDAPDGDPRPGRRARRRHARSSTAAPTGRRSARTRCSSRSGSRCATARAAPTRRWTAASATGRSPPPAPSLTLRDGVIARTPGSRSRRSAATSPASRPSEAAARPRARRTELFARGRRRGRRGVRAGHRPARFGRLQAPRRRGAGDRALRSRRAAARAARARRRDAGDDVGQRPGAHARGRAADCCWCTSCATSLRLTGTHWGCDTSNCGTCVVLMDGEPVKSCTVLAATAAGHERADGRGARGRRRARSGPAGLQPRSTGCSAASAPRGC